MKKEVLRMDHVDVRHSGRFALENFHLNLYEGEFLFVYGFPDSGIRELGEILKGTCEVQRGRFYISGKEVNASAFRNPGQQGIYIVQNDNNLVEEFTVAENLFFGGKKHYFRHTVSRKQQELMAKRLLERFELPIDPSGKIGRVNYFQQILVKLVMAYARGAKIVVLDGIIDFSQVEDDRMFTRVLRILLEDGIAVLWLNQRMDQARRMADRFLILRKGKNVRTVYKGYEHTLDQLLNIIIHTDAHAAEEPENNSAPVVFRMDHLNASRISDMSLRIRKGEILALCSANTLLMAQWRNIVCGEEQDFTGRKAWPPAFVFWI